MSNDKHELSDVAIVLTSHPRQQKWFEPVLLALENYPGPAVWVYDDLNLGGIPEWFISRFERQFTNFRILCTGYPASQLGHGRGELVCMRAGFLAAAELGARYCFKLGFDEPPWRWRHLPNFIDRIKREALGVIDCDTRIVIGRTPTVVAIMEAHDVVERGYGAAENYWRSVCTELGIQRRYISDRSYWERELGLLHLQGEYAHNVGQKNRYSWNIGEIWKRPNNAR
jgi:hypothetical protein